MSNLTFGLAHVVTALLEGGQHEVVDLFEESLLVLAADGDVAVVEIDLDWVRAGVRWTWLVPRVKVVRMGLLWADLILLFATSQARAYVVVFLLDQLVVTKGISV